MVGLFHRRFRRHWSSLAVWAMLPLVFVSDRAIYGCIDVGGKVNATCRCCASSARSKCCCCHGKMRLPLAVRNVNERSDGHAITAGHCRAITVYAAQQAVSPPDQAVLFSHGANCTAAPATALVSAACRSDVAPLERDTGQIDLPPALSTLHRWII